MSIVGVLRSLSLIVASTLALAMGVAVVAAIEVLLLASVAFWSPQGCTATVHQRIAGLSDFAFEIREAGCNILANDATTSVFISRVGGTKKTLLFKYVPHAPTASRPSPRLMSTPFKYRSGGIHHLRRQDKWER